MQTQIKSAQDPVVTKSHLKNKKPPTGDIIEEFIVKNYTVRKIKVYSKIKWNFYYNLT